MSRSFILLLMTFIGNLAFAQNGVYEKVIKELESNYNSNSFDRIFNAFAPEMQNALPLAKTNEFFSELKMQAGNIIKNELIEFQGGTTASYKASFEKTTLLLTISIDKERKIKGLFFKPFEDEKNVSREYMNALSEISQELSETIFNQVKDFPNKTQLSIAFIEDGEVSFYGIEIENDAVKFVDNKDNIFEIGSITKIFTSTILADLVVKKKINLDDNINKYFDFSFKDNTNISFINLVNHTSGLERLPSNLDFTKINQHNPYKEYDKEKLNCYLKNELKLENKSGEKYNYSNLGIGLLGYALGRSQNCNYNELLSKNIFDKYQMTNSFTNKCEANGRLIKGLDGVGNEAENWDFDVLFPAGGVLSNVEDLSKFMIAQFNPSNKDLALTREPTFTVNENLKIALGWHIIKLESEDEIYWHNGGTGGYSSSMAVDIKNKNGIVILSNVSAFSPNMNNIDNLCFELMKRLEKK